MPYFENGCVVSCCFPTRSTEKCPLTPRLPGPRFTQHGHCVPVRFPSSRSYCSASLRSPCWATAENQPACGQAPKSGGKFKDDPLPEKPPEGWQEYVQEKFKAYSIWLPKTGRKLEQTEGSVTVKDFGRLGFVILKCEIDNDITLNVERLIIPLQKGEMIDADKAITFIRDLHMDEFPGKITEEYDLMLGKMPGKEYRVDLKSGEKSRLRVYQIGKAIWRIWVTGTKQQVMGDTTKLIFASFKNQILLKGK